MLNGIIVLDKPLGKTSHDMVYFVRRLVGQKRVGHTGTLDPQASGVLPICVGMATKASDYLMSSGKEYIAKVKLGVVTDTQDATGQVLKENLVNVTKEEVEASLSHFVGEIEQLPPMYSAIKQNGQKLYDLARRGIEVERRPRRVLISALTLSDWNEEEHTFYLQVACGKGTYIRTLAHDIGSYLGCGAHMASLRRTKSGGYTLDRAYTLEKLTALKEEGRLSEAIIPLDSVYQSYRPTTLNEKETFRVRNGIPISFGAEENSHWRLYSCDGEFLCVSTVHEGKLVMDTSFWCGG